MLVECQHLTCHLSSVVQGDPHAVVDEVCLHDTVSTLPCDQEPTYHLSLLVRHACCFAPTGGFGICAKNRFVDLPQLLYAASRWLKIHNMR